MSIWIFRLTMGQILGQRRTLLMLVFAGIPILIAVVFRIGRNASEDPVDFLADFLLNNLIVQLIVPLTALVFGTAALGQEIEDGTVAYLLSKPLPRWRIVMEKVAAAWLVTAAAALVSVVGAGLVVVVGESSYRLIPAFVVATTLGALAYVSLFVCLSVISRRALIIGLIYVFVWEASLTDAVSATRYLSIRECTLGIAGALADAPKASLDVPLGPIESFAFLAAVAAGAILYATRSLGLLQIGERT
jgi:ABC-2 type transport system permease protein